MKRLIFFSLALAATMMSWANMPSPADYRVVCKDGTVAYFSGSDTEMTFSEDATILYVAAGAYTMSYAINGIEAIEFAQAGAYSGKYSYSGAHIDVAIDSSDDTSYTEVEDILPNEGGEEAGDFIEFQEVVKKIVISYKGTSVEVNGKIVNKATSVGNATILINGAHVEVTPSSSKASVKDYAFYLTGETTDGSFKLGSSIKRSRIVLNGVSITNPTGAAINIQSGKTMFIELADGTTNNLTDGTSYTLEGEEQQKGTFFSEGQLIFSGNGSLNVKSNYGHGIASDDYVRVRGGNITINSVRDGISTKDRFIMYGGALTIKAGQDGVDVGEGYIEIGGGKLNIQAGDEGITASYEGDEDTGEIDPEINPSIEIKGGLIKVATTGDKGHGIRAMADITMSGGIVQVTTKGDGSKALMSEGDMSLAGGKVTIFTEGNALYEEGELSSSAGIRSKGILKVENMTLGIKSTGTGAKGINNVGDITLQNSNVTVVALGAAHKHNGLESHSRGITADEGLTVNGGSLLVRSFDTPLYLGEGVSFLGNAVYGGYQIGE